MAEYRLKPTQFRLPEWASEFLAEEAAATGGTKTDVVLDALEALKRVRFEERMKEGYIAMAAENLEEARAWEGTLMDGLEPEEW